MRPNCHHTAAHIGGILKDKYLHSFRDYFVGNEYTAVVSSYKNKVISYLKISENNKFKTGIHLGQHCIDIIKHSPVYKKPHLMTRHDMETLSALLALCELNVLISSGFPH